ncbi:MAG: class I SAM-dependent methyltransferase [Candidatus Asgardarchaeia archaeon]
MAKEKYKYEKIYQGKGIYRRNRKIDKTGKIRKTYGRENCGKKHLQYIINEIQPTSIIDVGCGSNKFCAMLKKTNIKSIGIDCACPLADVISDADNLPFHDNQFDLLTAFDVLEHIPEEEIDIVFKEFKRVAHRFMYQIALRKSPSSIDHETLHPTVKPYDWWIDKITKDDPKIIKIMYKRKRYIVPPEDAKKLIIYGIFDKT